MTCIVGLVDNVSHCVWVGGDSLETSLCSKSVEHTPKIFRNELFKNVVIGGTTSFRHLDLLRYANDLFPEIDLYRKTSIDHRYMVTVFIPNVIKLFKKGIISEEEQNRGGTFIVGIDNKLFKIQEDYSVLEPESGYCAVGCGEDIALGSLYTTEGLNLAPADRVKIALEAAEKFSSMVQRPFHILNTLGE